MRRLALLLVLASVPPTAAAEVSIGRPVMGTVLQMTVVHADPERARAAAEAAVAAAVHWDDVLTTWRPEGELMRLNQRAGGGRVAISAELGAALARMESLWRATGGAFDPAVGPLVRWWSRPEAARVGRPATPWRWSDAVKLDAGGAALAPGASLDAGGIGKGIALDAAATYLRAQGIEVAFLDFGRSSLLALGTPPGEPRGWPVLVSGLHRGSAHGVIFLRDQGMSTSRSSGAGDEAGPIVDPATGRPVAAGRLTTAIATDATTAEAWSKALVVLGRSALGRAETERVVALFEDASGVEGTLARRVAERAS